MKRRDWVKAAVAGPAALCSPLVRAQAGRPPVGELKPLGQDRFQIGQVVVDKRLRAFTVPGRVHALGRPLEYLATSPRGMKEYEALFELDATGSEFNLACILVGLERDARVTADPWSVSKPLVGPRVAIFIAWQDGGVRRKVSAAQAVLNADADAKPESVEWVYIGAPAGEIQGRFAADVTGTLVGFKPDGNNIIQSALGLGIGAYGSVRGHAMLPPNGSPIELIVEAAVPAK